MNNPVPFVFGVLPGGSLIGDISNASLCQPPSTVTLTQSYLMMGKFPGQADCLIRPFQSSPSNQSKDVLPQLFPSGTTFRLHNPEAAALIAAGAATLVSVG